MRRGKSDGSTANDRYLVGELLLAASCVDVYTILRFGAVTLGQKSLESSYRDGFVNFATAAGRLTGMRTNATTDAGQRIGVAGKTIGLFKTAFRDQTNIAPGIGMGRAGHHAGKVGIKPISVDLLILIALQHGAMPLLQLEESSGSGGGGRSPSRPTCSG